MLLQFKNLVFEERLWYFPEESFEQEEAVTCNGSIVYCWGALPRF